jgi:hypothetical protein
MSEDYRRSNSYSKMVEQMVLRDISIHVKDMGRDITNYGLPELDASGKLIHKHFIYLNITNSNLICH